MLIQIQNIAEMLIAANVLSQILYCCCFPSTITQLTGVINNVFYIYIRWFEYYRLIG